MSAKSTLGVTAWSVLLIGALGTLFVPGCGTDGQTGNCPELSLYDINAAGERNSPEVKAERDKSVDAGCMTPLGNYSMGGSP
jgi:hypothetical protein